jgi:hypothetical protein
VFSTPDGTPIRYESTESLTQAETLRRWVEREREKEEYPDADPSGWSNERLVHELEETYDEPAGAATRGTPTWTAVTLDGAEVGGLDAFPACGWDALSGDGQIADAVDRLRSESLSEAFPDATDAIAWFRSAYRDERSFGGLVARQFDGEWPPVLLEGNHRACAAGWLAREGHHVSVTVHLGHEQPLAALPLVERD